MGFRFKLILALTFAFIPDSKELLLKEKNQFKSIVHKNLQKKIQLELFLYFILFLNIWSLKRCQSPFQNNSNENQILLKRLEDFDYFWLRKQFNYWLLILKLSFYQLENQS